jgi:hypothetical protein
LGGGGGGRGHETHTIPNISLSAFLLSRVSLAAIDRLEGYRKEKKEKKMEKKWKKGGQEWVWCSMVNEMREKRE